METNKISYAEISYLSYFLVLFGAKSVGLYEGMLLYNISLVIGVLLFGIKIILTKHTVFEYLIITGLVGVSIIVYYNTGEKGLLLYFTMMIGMKGVSVKRVFKWATLILGSCFTCLVFLTSFGFMQDIYYTKERSFFGMVMRRSLGYPYPNTLFTTYIVLMVLIMYVLGKMEKKKLIIVSLLEFLGALYMFLYSCSNTGIIVSTTFLVLNYYFQTRKSFTGLEKMLIQLVYPGCILFSVVGPMISKGKLFEILDKVLHNRWNYSRYYLTNEPITLLGQRFKATPNTNYLIDSSFLYSFLQIGLVAFVILTVLNLLVIHDYVKKEKRIELAIIASFCILGLSDPFLYNLSYKNILFLFIGEYFYRKMEEIPKLLPSFFTKEIQWVRIGNNEVLVGSLCPYKLKKIFLRIGKELQNKSGFYIVLFFTTFVIITASYFVISFVANDMNILDNVEKWEYIRMGINSGIWGAILVVLVFIVYKRKHGLKESE